MERIKTYKEYKHWAIEKSIIKGKEFSFEKVDERYHYIYRVTNLETGLHYYGSRSSKSLDIGVKYFTSSKYLKEDFKERTQNYKIKIIKIFDNTKDKEIYESYLHQYFNVRLHDKFYNKANQTPFGHDTTGIVNCVDINGNNIQVTKEVFDSNKTLHNINKYKQRTDEVKSKISITKKKRKHLYKSQKNLVTVRNKENEIFKVSIDDERYINGELIHISIGTKRTTESKIKISSAVQKIQKEYINCKDKYGNNIRVLRTDERYLNGELVHVNTGNTAHNKGIPRTDEQKRKQSEKMKGREGKLKGKKAFYTSTGIKVYLFKHEVNDEYLTFKQAKQQGLI